MSGSKHNIIDTIFYAIRVILAKSDFTRKFLWEEDIDLRVAIFAVMTIIYDSTLEDPNMKRYHGKILCTNGVNCGYHNAKHILYYMANMAMINGELLSDENEQFVEEIINAIGCSFYHDKTSSLQGQKKKIEENILNLIEDESVIFILVTLI